MRLEEIEAEWAKDSVIDKDRLDDASLGRDQLHSKYMRILSAERMKWRALGEKKKLLTQKLEDYYNGKIDGRDIGREPWQLKEGSKGSIEKRVENDKELIDMNLQSFAQEEKVLLVKEIISCLNNRSFSIGNAIKFLAWSKGDLL